MGKQIVEDVAMIQENYTTECVTAVNQKTKINMRSMMKDISRTATMITMNKTTAMLETMMNMTAAMKNANIDAKPTGNNMKLMMKNITMTTMMTIMNNITTMMKTMINLTTVILNTQETILY